MHPSKFLLICSMLSVILAATVAETVPRKISYQGRLLDNSGQPVDTVVDITFTIHSDSALTKPIWTETQTAVTIADGLFALSLGSVNPLDKEVVTGETLWMTLKMLPDGDESEPMPLNSTIYSFNSWISDTARHALFIRDNCVDSTKITNGSISLADLGQNGAVGGQAIVWEDGTGWVPATGSGDGISTFFPGSGAAGYISNDTIFMWVAEKGIINWHIASNAVDSSCLDNDAVVSRTIAPDAVDSTHIADEAIGTDQIQDHAVDYSKLANDAVYRDHIVDGSVTSDKIKDSTILPIDISTVGASADDVLKFDGSAWEFAPDEAGGAGEGDITAVLTGSGLTGGGTSGAVTVSIGTGTVTSTHLANSSVYSAEIADGTIMGGDISPTAAISRTKIAGTAATQVAQNTFTNKNIFEFATDFNKVQIGTSSGSHGHWLEARSAGFGTTNATAHIENTNAGGIGLWVEATSTDLPVLISQHGTGDILRCDCFTGGWHEVFKVRNDGVTEVDELKIMGGADISEPFPVTDKVDLPNGALVVIDEHNPGHLKLSDQPYDTRVAGVISGAGGVDPGLTLQQRGVMEDGQLVALNGRVYALVDASYGAIRPGDLLTTSATPGYAMKVTDRTQAYGAVIGKAMTELESGRGLVLVLVNLQ